MADVIVTSQTGMTSLAKQVDDLELDEGYLSNSSTAIEHGHHVQADEIIRQVCSMLLSIHLSI